MYRIAIIHDIEKQCSRGVLRWAYATRSYCLQKYAPPDFEVTRLADADLHKYGWAEIARRDYDLMFAIDYALVDSYVKDGRRAGLVCPVVGSFNKDHHSRHNEWKSAYRYSDFLIVNNMLRWEHEGRPPKTCCISNGLDLDHWKVVTPWQERPNKVIWTGGVGRNKKKGYGEVLYPLKGLLEPEFECDFRVVRQINEQQLLTPDEMLDWYNTARYVVCASETEGTPGYLLEAMACGSVPVTTYVGNVPEIFSDEVMNVVLDRKPERFADAIRLFATLDKTPPDATFREGIDASKLVVQAMASHWGYGPPANRADYFYALFRRIIRDGPQSVEPFTHWEVKPEDI